MKNEEVYRIEQLERQLEEKDKELKRFKKKYENLFEDAPLGIYKSSADGKFLEMNDTLAGMLGYNNKEEAIDAIQDIEKDIYLKQKLREEKARQLLNSSDYLDYDIDFLRKDGSIFTGRVIAKAIKDKDQKSVSFFGFIQDVTTRKKERIELEASHELFYNTFNNSLDSNFILSLKDLSYIEVNQVFLDNTNSEYEDIIGMTSFDIGYFLTEKDSEEIITTIKNEGKIRNRVISINIKNEKRWFSINAIRIKWKGEDCAYISSRDITEEKRINEKLSSSEVKFRSLVTNANLGIIIIQNLKIKYANPSAIKMYGYDDDEEIPQDSFDYIHPDDLDFMKRQYIRRLAGENISGDYNIRMKKKDGSLIHVNMRVAQINWENNPALLVFTNDITESVIARKKLKESEEKYNKIFKNIHDVYYELELNGEISFISPSLKFLNGMSPEDFIGKNILDYYVDPSQRDELLKKLHKNCKVSDFEIILRDEKTNTFHFSISSVFIYNDSGKPIKIAGVMRNITKRKKAEQKLKDSEMKLQELIKQKNIFFNLIAHDLRSPISGFMNLTEDISKNYAQLTLNDMKESIQTLNKSSTQIYDMLSNLLKWSSAQSGYLKIDKKDFDVFDLVESSIDLYEIKLKNKQIEVINDVRTGSSVYADISMVETVIQNLLNNALKYSEQNSTIHIFSELNNNDIRISVKDTGIGIDCQHIDSLFSLSGQYLQEGTMGEASNGIGLLLTKDFIERNNGTIGLSSKKGVGSTFYFTLPLSS